MKRKLIKTVNYKGCTIDIYKDYKAQNPRKWGINIATFISDEGLIIDGEGVYKTMYNLIVDYLPSDYIINFFCQIRRASLESNGGECFYHYWDNNKGWCKLNAGCDNILDDTLSLKILNILKPHEWFQMLSNSKEVAIFPMAQQLNKTTLTTYLCADYYDYDQVGIAFIDKSTIYNHYGSAYINQYYNGYWKECALQCMKMELALYNSYCNKKVYGYEIKDNDNRIENLGGYYGEDRITEAIEEAKHAIDKYLKQPKQLELWQTNG